MTTNRTIDLHFDLDLFDAELDLAFHEITYHLAILDSEGDFLLTLEGI